MVIIDSCFKGTWRFFDLTIPVTDDIKKRYPLYHYYHQYGRKIFHWWAAVMGCDVSKEKSGILDVGKKTFLSALASFNKRMDPPTAETFARALWYHSKLSVLLQSSGNSE